jgi:hypothetical protein
VVKSKNSQFKVTIPYHAHVLKGSLKVEEEGTHFFLPDLDNNGKGDKADALMSKVRPVEREVIVTNEFSVPVVVHKVTMGDEAKGSKNEDRYLQLRQFGPVILKPGEKAAVAKLVLKTGAWNDRLLDSKLTLHTNVSSMVVPLVVFHGKMDTVSKALKYAGLKN